MTVYQRVGVIADPKYVFCTSEVRLKDLIDQSWVLKDNEPISGVDIAPYAQRNLEGPGHTLTEQFARELLVKSYPTDGSGWKFRE